MESRTVRARSGGPFDVLVVGAGPAGATAALAALSSRPDASVVLVDKAAFPRDKACGDGIAPEVHDVLEALGAPEVLADAVGIPGVRVVSPAGRVAVGRHRRAAYVVPRSELDARIVAAAQRAGAELRQGRVRGITQDAAGVSVDAGAAGTLRARVVIAADGANSVVRRLLGVRANPPRATGLALRGYAPAATDDDEQRIVMSREEWPGYAWSFPDGRGTRNVGFGLLGGDVGGGGRALLRRRLGQLVPDAVVDQATLRAHHLPLSSARPRAALGRVLLAGDAASLINPLTGEGIYYAVVSGSLAGRAALAARPAAAYREALRASLGRHLRHTSVLARLVSARPVIDAAVAAAAAQRRVFDEIVAVGLSDGRLSLPSLWQVATRVPAAVRA